MMVNSGISSSTLGNMLLVRNRTISGFRPGKLLRFAGVNAPKYASRFKDLAADLAVWEKEGSAVLLLSGGEARAQRVQSALKELYHPVPLWEEARDVGAGADLFNHLRITASYGLGISRAMSYIDKEYNGDKVYGKDRHWTLSAAWLF